LKRSYIYSGAQPIVFYQGDYTDPAYIYLHDRLGSVRLLIDESGDVANCYTYEPFGELLATESAETTENPFRFTGQWYDSEIDQYYLRARYYDPYIGRFSTRNPIVGEAGQS
jgi:RHS repeat-associated protein